VKNPAAVEAPAGNRRWWVLAALGLAQLMTTLDATVMNIALPTAQAELEFSDANRAWILTAYTLAFGSLLLVSGRLADRFGRRSVLVIGLAGFAIVSAIGGAAVSFEMLVAARAAQGVFAALLAPAALALVTSTFPSGRDRGRAFGIFAAISVAGSTIGLVLGGVLVEFLSWRWTMFINIAFAIPAIIGALLLLPQAAGNRAVRIDAASTITVTLGLLGLVYGFTNAGEDSWSAPLTIASLVLGTAFILVFFLLQPRIANPLLPLRVLRDRDRAGGLLAMLVGFAGLLAVIFFSVYYVQGVLGWTAIQTGVAFLPQPLMLVIGGVFLGPRLNRRFGAKVVIPAGLLIAAVGVLLLLSLDGTSEYGPDILPTLLLLGLGLGLCFPIATGLSTRGLESEDTGVGSALVGTVQQVGGSVGLAVLNTVATTATAAYLAGRAPTAQVTVHAVVDGYDVAYGGAAALFIAAAITAAIVLRRRRVETP
jgi:EmrB/QacA subfamily drug resistance transporter